MNTLESLQNCNLSFHPNTWKLLTNLVTIPVSTLHQQRETSALLDVVADVLDVCKRFYNQQTMAKNRLSSSALIKCTLGYQFATE